MPSFTSKMDGLGGTALGNHLHAALHFCADTFTEVAPARRGLTAAGILQVGEELASSVLAWPLEA